MFNVYKITYAGTQPRSHDLMGLLIIQSDAGIFLVDSESSPEKAPRVLANGLVGIDGPPFFQFNMHFKELHWTINVNNTSSTELTGRWSNKKHQTPKPPDEDDNWTAKGTGTGAGEPGEDDEARAASAKY